MPYYPSQTDINALFYHGKTLKTKIALLNTSFQTIHKIEGALLTLDLNTDVDADIRTTVSMSLAITDDSIGIGEDKAFWINRYIKISIGYECSYLTDILWYDKGIFVISEFSTDVSRDSAKVLSIGCLDLVCTLDGTVGGDLDGLKTTIFEKDKFTIREAIILTLTDLTP